MAHERTRSVNYSRIRRLPGWQPRQTGGDDPSACAAPAQDGTPACRKRTRQTATAVSRGATVCNAAGGDVRRGLGEPLVPLVERVRAARIEREHATASGRRATPARRARFAAWCASRTSASRSSRASEFTIGLARRSHPAAEAIAERDARACGDRLLARPERRRHGVGRLVVHVRARMPIQACGRGGGTRACRRPAQRTSGAARARPRSKNVSSESCSPAPSRTCSGVGSAVGPRRRCARRPALHRGPNGVRRAQLDERGDDPRVVHGAAPVGHDLQRLGVVERAAGTGDRRSARRSSRRPAEFARRSESARRRCRPGSRCRPSSRGGAARSARADRGSRSRRGCPRRSRRGAS